MLVQLLILKSLSANGDTSFFISKDGGSIHDNNVVPGAYNSLPRDNASNSGVDLSTGTIHGVQNFGLQQKIDGFGKVELRYAPDVLLQILLAIKLQDLVVVLEWNTVFLETLVLTD